MNWFENKPVIALAPLADYTDSPFCRICREVAGSDFVIFREMVSAEAIVRDNVKTLKMCEFDEIERPIVVQIFGANPVVMRKAARMIVNKYKPDGIDINMGCPVPKIASKTSAGAALMKNHKLAIEIVEELKKENLGVPVSVKTRLGWSMNDEILEFAPKLEAAGADLISLHGRTKLQGYTGAADWQTIAEVKKIIKIPLIANGDVTNNKDLTRCLEVTGADGVMIGRAALGNPWMLNQSKNINPDIKEIIRVVLRHAHLHLERYGEEKGITSFRKHLACYFKGHKISKEIKTRLMCVSDISGLSKILSNIV